MEALVSLDQEWISHINFMDDNDWIFMPPLNSIYTWELGNKLKTTFPNLEKWFLTENQSNLGFLQIWGKQSIWEDWIWIYGCNAYNVAHMKKPIALQLIFHARRKTHVLYFETCLHSHKNRGKI